MSRRTRPIRIEGNTAYVQLTQGYEAVIDAADVPLVAPWNWHADVDRRSDGSIRTVYAIRSGSRAGKKLWVSMHRVIAGATDGTTPDHIDNNGLNNRKVNLRLATSSQQQHNTRVSIKNSSGVKGVCFHRSNGKWQAQIMVGRKRKHIGYFSDLESAAEAYAKASAELHGEFGRVA